MEMRTLLSAALLMVLLIALPLSAADTDLPCNAGWSYSGTNGPDYWGQLKPEWGVCDTGAAQSPIRIIPGVLDRRMTNVELNYPPLPFTVQNNGHELKVYPLGNATVRVNGIEARLVQFHFHTPAEHFFKTDPAPLPAEIHFVNERLDGKGYIVLAVYLTNGGRDFPALSQIIDAKPLPPSACRSKKSEQLLDYRSLIAMRTEHYATYSGSLTTPACAEKVTWIVFLDPAPKVSQAQISELSIESNARPLQPAAGRVIKWRDPF
jgi:carbonic anhydrase